MKLDDVAQLLANSFLHFGLPMSDFPLRLVVSNGLQLVNNVNLCVRVQHSRTVHSCASEMFLQLESATNASVKCFGLKYSLTNAPCDGAPQLFTAVQRMFPQSQRRYTKANIQ